jgi:hypothetical protein
MNLEKNSYEQELRALKACIAEQTAGQKRRHVPKALKARVLALRQAGIPMSRLAAELGLKSSQLYAWAKTTRAAPARVFQVQAPAQSSKTKGTANDAVLHLRLGAFCISVELAEA